MQITALVKSVDHVCCRYRLSAYRPFLEGAGHSLRLLAMSRTWLRGFRLPRQLEATDLIVVQRRLLAQDQLVQLRERARWLIFDFDDAVFLRDSYAVRGQHSERRLAGFADMVRFADVVVAGNPFLAEQASLWKAQDVRIIPTCVNAEEYAPARHRRTEGVKLAWIGSSATLQGLQRARSLWENIGCQVAGASLKVICDRSLRLEHLPVQFCPWSERVEAAELAAADIGISWLPDDLWSQGKCGLKVLQYMAAGLPVVANPVGLQAHLVEHERTGFLVSTPAEWIEAVARLARDPLLRERMGLAGRRRVQTDFDLSRGAGRWLDLLRRLEERSSSSLVSHSRPARQAVASEIDP